jgi:hypothetical protein
MILRATLITDGSSDTVLLPILRWLVTTLTEDPVSVQWADLRGLRAPPRRLADRLTRAIELYPCRLLFVHRDAEAQPPDRRYQEIREANSTTLPHVCVVPVRMQEAWLLHDEEAIREAAGRPSGGIQLDLPPARKWEQIADPKEVLYRALRSASGFRGRRAKRFRPAMAAHRVASLVTDWSPLLQLSAFQRLELDTKAALLALGAPSRRKA